MTRYEDDRRGKGMQGKCGKGRPGEYGDHGHGSFGPYGRGPLKGGYDDAGFGYDDYGKGAPGCYGKGSGGGAQKGGSFSGGGGGGGWREQGPRGGDYGKGKYADDFGKGGWGGKGDYGKGDYGGDYGDYGDYGDFGKGKPGQRGKGGYGEYGKGGGGDYGKGWPGPYDDPRGGCHGKGWDDPYGGYGGGYAGGACDKGYGKGFEGGCGPSKGWGGPDPNYAKGQGWGKGGAGKGHGGYGGMCDAPDRGHAAGRLAEVADDCTVQLRGLPFKGTLADVERFLGPHARQLAGRDAIELLRNTEGQFVGRLSGVAVVRFRTPAAARAAAEQLNMGNIQDPGGGPDRYIEAVYLSCEKQSLVNRVKELQKYSRDNTKKWYAYCESAGTEAYDPSKHDEDFLRGFLTAFEDEVVFEPVASQSVEEEDDECTVQLRGVPFQATAENVMAFLSEHTRSSHVPDSCRIVYNKDGPYRGRPSGTAKVKFSTPEVAKRARDDLNMKNISDPGGGPDRYIEAFHNSSDHVELVRRVKDLQKFSRENRDKWYAFCEKRGSDIYDPSRHDDEFIRSFLAAFEEELDAMLSHGAGEDDADECAVNLRGLPFRAGFAEIKAFLGDHAHTLHEDEPIKIIYNQDGPYIGKPSGAARIKFVSADAAKAARADLNMRNIPDPGGGPDRWVEVLLPIGGGGPEDMPPAAAEERGGGAQGGGSGAGDEKAELVQRVKDLQRRGHDNRDKWYTYCERRGTSCHDPSRHDATFIRGFLDTFQERADDAEPAGGAAGDADEYDDCTVQLRGLPFRANATDVVKFLGPHARALQGDDSIKIIYNKDGQFAGKPSGVARVTLASREAALAVCTELNMKNIRDPAGGADRWVEVFAPGGRGDAADPYGPARHGGGSQRYDPYDGGGDAEKSELVERVKDLQRGNHENRDIWYAFCSMRETSCHDPGRHNAEFLQDFLAAFAEGNIFVPSWGGKGGKGGGKSWGQPPGNAWY